MTFRPRLSDDICAARSALMFEVFTTRIADQHIMLQAIRTGLLSPGTCEEGRRFIALLER